MNSVFFEALGWTDLIQIIIIMLIIYSILRVMRGTRGAGILKALAFLTVIAFVTVSFVTKTLGWDEIDYLLRYSFGWLAIAVIIIFQPELRRALIRLGHNPLFQHLLKGETRYIPQIVDAAVSLSKRRVGALIAVQRKVALGSYIEAGVPLDAEVKVELLSTIFTPGSPLHDGAVIIRDQRIAAAGCLLPLTDNPSVSKTMGTRHRAGLGLSEETDAVTIIISEENGKISVGQDGQMLRDIDANMLTRILMKAASESEESST